MVDLRNQLTTLDIEEVESDFTQATTMLTAEIRQKPNNPELYFERSICHYKLGNYQASLEDANAAIRLNLNEYNVHYQKGLALLGLSQFHEGIISFKKAISLRACQEDSKLSQIFTLLRDCAKEVDAAMYRLGLAKNSKTTGGKTVVQPNQGSDMLSATDSSGTNHHHLQMGTISNTNFVDSTTDRTPISLLMESGSMSFTNRGLNSLETHFRSTTNNTANNKNLVATKRNTSSTIIINNNNNLQPVQTQMMNGQTSERAGGSNCNANASCLGLNAGGLMNQNRVSSTASHISNNNIINNRHISSLQMTAATTSAVNVLPRTMPAIVNPSIIRSTNNIDLMGTSNERVDESRAAQFAWNIRRSERIFLHHTNEPAPPGTSVPASLVQNSLMQQQSVPSSAIAATSICHRLPSANGIEEKGPNKRSYESLSESNQQADQNQTVKSKEGSDSIVESEIDVDDSIAITSLATNPNFSNNDASVSKRVMIAPSSSMPATSLTPSTSTSSSTTTTTTKDDSYSSKYKRLRRDRERARRGTSKLCTIKLSDLEELHKPSEASNLSKRSMRVIAPIDGWLYSGQLSVDGSLSNNGTWQYVVKLDGDATGSSYLFSQETVLNDVIKEVRVKTVSELRKGARICCYWSRQYKCLSTGVVTSRTFEETKSLVSVKYDNGDLSALPLEDLRLLPPDYPKYMSNCDPLLLAKNGDGVSQQTNTAVATTLPIKSVANINQNGTRVVIMENKAPPSQQQQKQLQQQPQPKRAPHSSSSDDCDKEPSISTEEGPLEVDESYVADQLSDDSTSQIETEVKSSINDSKIIDEDEDASIPPTDETIDFITSESSMKIDDHHIDENDDAETDEDLSLAEQTNSSTKMTKDNMTASEATQPDNNNSNSRSSSEENNFGVTYCPWLFVGPPKRNKKHGRAYRDYYTSIRRGNEIIKVGDSAELMPRDESILPFIAKIDGFWATARGEMRVRVRWYYRLVETEDEPYEMPDGENALFETDHFDENDVQSIYRSTKILSWTEYQKDNIGHVNKSNDNAPKTFYLAGYYDPVRRTKHLRSDIKKAL